MSASIPSSLVQNRPINDFGPALRRALEQLQEDRLILRVPRMRGLRVRQTGSPFHATPELFFQQSGCTRFVMPEERFTLRAGEICLMPRWVPHAETTSAPPYRTIITMFQSGGFSLHSASASPQRTVFSHPAQRLVTAARANLEHYLDEIALLSDAGAGLSDPQVRGLLLATIGLMLRELERGKSTTAETKTNLWVARCRDLIQIHLGEPELGTHWLARRLGCTADHLSRVFRRETGRTLIHAIHEARLDAAKRMLTRSSGRITSVGEIAWACGYVSQSYFNRVFRAHTGLTPRVWRESAPPAGD